MPAPPPARRPAPAAVVVAGGTSRRWGGVDKTARPLAGRALLAHAVAAVLPGAGHLVVVAPPGHPARAEVEALAARAGCLLTWTREEPAGGGPLAALAAGAHALGGTGAPGRAVAVLAGDLPFTRPAWPRLLAALAADPDADAALGRDPDGRRQPLPAAYREAVLHERLAHAPTAGRPLRDLLAGLHVVEVPVTAEESLDLDTPEDAVRAEAHAAAAARDA